jgi:hypothetical protein
MTNPHLANVIRLPTQSCSRGKIWSEPLDLYFPRIFLLTNIDVSPDHPFPFRYSLDADPRLYGHSAAITEIDRPQAHGNSVILRHHQIPQAAGHYMVGFNDGAPYQSAQIRDNSDGTFTMVEVPTQSHWPAPLIIYDAFHIDEEQPLGFIHWQKAVLPTGEFLDDEEFDALLV